MVLWDVCVCLCWMFLWDVWFKTSSFCVLLAHPCCTSHVVTVVTYWLQTAYIQFKTAGAVLIAEVKERIELYVCSSSGLSWLVIGRILLYDGVKIYPVVCIRRSVEMEVKLYSSFNLGAKWGGWSTPRPWRFYLPRKETQHPLHWGLDAPQFWVYGCE